MEMTKFRSRRNRKRTFLAEEQSNANSGTGQRQNEIEGGKKKLRERKK